jgi:hypothetical protein
MIEDAKSHAQAESVHLGFNEQRQPHLRGESNHYIIARGDQLAFAAEVVRFGFAPDDFVLDIQRLPGKPSARPAAAYSVKVEHVRSRRNATYFGGPGRAWVADFLGDLIVGKFGQP